MFCSVAKGDTMKDVTDLVDRKITHCSRFMVIILNHLAFVIKIDSLLIIRNLVCFKTN